MIVDDPIGRTVKLFLVDGTPTGIISAEIMNWTGHVVAVPRSLLAKFALRPESNRTGVYLLLGTDLENPDRPTAYIGETEEIFSRLRQHVANSEKDFFDRVIVITSKDDTLTKAHARYLESSLHKLAKDSANWRVIGIIPPGAKLPESDIADMNFFLRQVQIVLPVLGVDLLEKAPTQQSDVGSLARERGFSIEFVLQSKSGADARAVEIGGQFVVLNGSYATAQQYAANNYEAHRKRLIDSGKLAWEENGNRFKFTEDVAFTSPSAASATILNRNDNGKNSWKVSGTNETYGQWSSAQIASLTLEDLEL